MSNEIISKRTTLTAAPIIKHRPEQIGSGRVGSKLSTNLTRQKKHARTHTFSILNPKSHQTKHWERQILSELKQKRCWKSRVPGWGRWKPRTWRRDQWSAERDKLGLNKFSFFGEWKREREKKRDLEICWGCGIRRPKGAEEVLGVPAGRRPRHSLRSDHKLLCSDSEFGNRYREGRGKHSVPCSLHSSLFSALKLYWVYSRRLARTCGIKLSFQFFFWSI